MKGFMLSIFVICAVFATAHSIKCYVCGPATEEACSKSKLEGDKKYQQDCDVQYNQCARVWGKDKHGTTAVINGCTNDAGCLEAKAACNKAKDDKEEGDCAVGCCDTDLCNAGSSASFSVFLVTVCSVLGLALLK